MINKSMVPGLTEKIAVRQNVRSVFDAERAGRVLVKAAPGYGKTVAFLAAAEQVSGIEIYWYNLDITDENPDCFLSSMEKMWKRADGLDAVAASDEERLRSLAERAAGWDGARCIVMDDAQAVRPEKIWQMVSYLMRELPDVSFVVMTNGGLPAEMNRILWSGGAALLTERDLRLDAGAAKESFSEKTELSDAAWEKLTEDLRGWPLGIRLAADYFAKKGISEPDEENGFEWDGILSASGLSECLRQVFLEPASEEERRFMAETAVTGEFSWDMCRAVLPDSLTRELFEKVVRGGMVQPVKGRDGFYEYGRALRHFLLWQVSESEKKEIRGRAAEYCLAAEDYPRMTRYAIEGGQTKMLAAFLEKSGEAVLGGDHADVLRDIIDFFEGGDVPLSPEASGIAAQFFYSRGERERMGKYLNAADSAFGTENKFGCYRSLYRALARFDENPGHYRKQINNALFFLKEKKQPMPYLTDSDRTRLNEITGSGSEPERDLYVRAFGSFHVMAGEEKKELAWRTRKGRELFAYLLDINGEAVERRQLLETLWQDEIPDNAVPMLHNMIYNIRRELSAYCLESVLIFENKKYRLDMKKISADLTKIKELAALAEAGDITGLRKHGREFLTFWGKYLDNIDSPWAEGRRRYFDEMYLRGCFMLAEAAEEEDGAFAVRLYRNILEVDPYSEKAAEKLLLLYGRQKQWEMIRTTYSEFCRILREDLGIVPGREVRQAYSTYLKE